MQYEHSSDNYKDVVEPVRRIYGAYGAGPIEVGAVDGMVHIALGEQGAYLDRRQAGLVVRAITDALDRGGER
jgi:hypothetical protein